MPDEHFEVCSPMPVAADDLYAWHAWPGAFQRLQPPWERVEVLEHTGGIRDGARIRLRARVGPLWSEWRVHHEGHEEGRRFCDVLDHGPFAAWRHEHRFEPHTGDASSLVDSINYRLPFGAPGAALGRKLIQRKLARIFRFRHDTTRADLELWRAHRDSPRLKILVTGSSGLIGTALAPFLTTQGHEVVRLSRSAGAGVVRWDPARGEIDAAALTGIDAVVHLAGSNVAAGRWTAARRREILDSRVNTTRLLVDALARLPVPPRAFLCASGAGFYGDTGDEIADENSPGGEGFLSDVCRQWEAEAMRASTADMRVALFRAGVVLSPRGGALARLLPLFRLGLGGAIGGGRTWMSWISIDDLLGAIAHALVSETLTGPVNAVAPGAVRGREFASTLARVLQRPAILPVPAFALRLVYGRMAEETLLASSRVAPQRLIESGYRFRHASLESALRHQLGR